MALLHLCESTPRGKQKRGMHITPAGSNHCPHALIHGSHGSHGSHNIPAGATTVQVPYTLAYRNRHGIRVSEPTSDHGHATRRAVDVNRPVTSLPPPAFATTTSNATPASAFHAEHTRAVARTVTGGLTSPHALATRLDARTDCVGAMYLATSRGSLICCMFASKDGRKKHVAGDAGVVDGSQSASNQQHVESQMQTAAKNDRTICTGAGGYRRRTLERSELRNSLPNIFLSASPQSGSN